MIENNYTLSNDKYFEEYGLTGQQYLAIGIPTIKTNCDIKKKLINLHTLCVKSINLICNNNHNNNVCKIASNGWKVLVNKFKLRKKKPSKVEGKVKVIGLFLSKYWINIHLWCIPFWPSLNEYSFSWFHNYTSIGVNLKVILITMF